MTAARQTSQLSERTQQSPAWARGSGCNRDCAVAGAASATLGCGVRQSSSSLGRSSPSRPALKTRWASACRVKPLTSADLFSGAGGLTEGFSQAGYDVLASLDNWGPAAETHRRNFPRTETFHADVLELDPLKLPKVDVLIGSPPCTEFSYSNRGGHGDLGLGMKLDPAPADPLRGEL